MPCSTGLKPNLHSLILSKVTANKTLPDGKCNTAMNSTSYKGRIAVGQAVLSVWLCKMLKIRLYSYMTVPGASWPLQPHKHPCPVVI